MTHATIGDNNPPEPIIADCVRKNHKTASIEGVRVWQEKEAY